MGGFLSVPLPAGANDANGDRQPLLFPAAAPLLSRFTRRAAREPLYCSSPRPSGDDPRAAPSVTAAVETESGGVEWGDDNLSASRFEQLCSTRTTHLPLTLGLFLARDLENNAARLDALKDFDDADEEEAEEAERRVKQHRSPNPLETPPSIGSHRGGRADSSESCGVSRSTSNLSSVFREAVGASRSRSASVAAEPLEVSIRCLSDGGQTLFFAARGESQRATPLPLPMGRERHPGGGASSPPANRGAWEESFALPLFEPAYT